MENNLKDKYNALIEIIESYKTLVVAFSGGTDSSLLLKVAQNCLKDNVLAVTIGSAFTSDYDVKAAREFIDDHGIAITIASVDVLSHKDIPENPPDRCYHCKKVIFETIIQIAREKGITTIAEGSNADDSADYRPGKKALQELKIESPLKEAGLTKDEIRKLSKELGLKNWDRPSSSCLATRFPYGTHLTKEGLHRIAEAEKFLRSFGFGYIRVRDHDDIARIELTHNDMQKILSGDTGNKIVAHLKNLGYTYVTLDLEGFRSGSMDEVLEKEKDRG